MALAMLALNLPRSGLVQHQDTADGGRIIALCLSHRLPLILNVMLSNFIDREFL